MHQYERAIASGELYYIWYLYIGYICANSQGDAVIHQKAIAPKTRDVLKQCIWFSRIFTFKGSNTHGQ